MLKRIRLTTNTIEIRNIKIFPVWENKKNKKKKFIQSKKGSRNIENQRKMRDKHESQKDGKK